MPETVFSTDFGAIQLGDRAAIVKRFDEEDVAAFAALSNDNNPLHMESGRAENTRFGRRVVHGMLVASYVSTLVGMRLPGTGALWMRKASGGESWCFWATPSRSRPKACRNPGRPAARDPDFGNQPGRNRSDGRRGRRPRSCTQGAMVDRDQLRRQIEDDRAAVQRNDAALQRAADRRTVGNTRMRRLHRPSEGPIRRQRAGGRDDHTRS